MVVAEVAVPAGGKEVVGLMVVEEDLVDGI